MSNILKTINQELARHVDLKYKKGATNFFREPVKIKGVRVPRVRKIALKHFQEIKTLSKKEIFELIEEMFTTGVNENITIGLDWLFRLKKKYERRDFNAFEGWLRRYVTNWASCDDFCTHPIGYLVWKYPSLLPKVFAWTNSPKRWVKRAAAVSLIYPIRKTKDKEVRQKILKQIFRTSDALIKDQDDMVQKGYGWTLKVAADQYQNEVFKYVLKNKTKMPRTALRYAIEKMPAKKKKKAMLK